LKNNKILKILAQSRSLLINSKTSYKMTNKKKPHLANIQEFGVAAYVKDLKAGKLHSRCKLEDL